MLLHHLNRLVVHSLIQLDCDGPPGSVAREVQLMIEIHAFLDIHAMCEASGSLLSVDLNQLLVKFEFDRNIVATPAGKLYSQRLRVIALVCLYFVKSFRCGRMQLIGDTLEEEWYQWLDLRIVAPHKHLPPVLVGSAISAIGRLFYVTVIVAESQRDALVSRSEQLLQHILLLEHFLVIDELLRIPGGNETTILLVDHSALLGSQVELLNLLCCRLKHFDIERSAAHRTLYILLSLHLNSVRAVSAKAVATGELHRLHHDGHADGTVLLAFINFFLFLTKWFHLI